MRQEFTVVTAQTPVGDILLAETSEEYTQNIAKAYESMEYEAPVVDAIRASDADLFIDAGAGFGFFTLVAASTGKRVVAFEPHPLRYGYLWSNVKNLANVMPFQMGIGDKVGDVDAVMVAHPNGIMGNQLHGPEVRATINMTTIDKVLAGMPHRKALIKLDIEGFETEALNAAILAIPKREVSWIIEFHGDFVDVEGLLAKFANHPKKILHSRDRYNTVTYFIEGAK